jgi:mono/diheme cytochrome c family protein
MSLPASTPRKRWPWPSLAVVAALATTAAAAPAQSRGELLYNIHCVACHNEKVHWRDQKLARDWNRLQELVRQWQANAQLDWSEEDIQAVARYLNEAIYRLPGPPMQLGAAPPSARRRS